MPVLIAIVGAAIVFGKNRPVLVVAGLFLVLGIYVGQEWTDLSVTEELTRFGRALSTT